MNMEFTDCLDGIAHLNLAPHGRTGLKYPYKLLLLAMKPLFHTL